MEPDARPILLAFAGTFCGSFALAIAALAGDVLAATCALGMTTFCAAEFATAAANA